MTTLWLNVVSNHPNCFSGGSDRVFWAIEFNDREQCLEDAKSYPRPGKAYGTVYYVETTRIAIGNGFDILEDEAKNQRSLRTWLPKVPA